MFFSTRLEGIELKEFEAVLQACECACLYETFVNEIINYKNQ